MSESTCTSRGYNRKTLKPEQLDEAVNKWFAQHCTVGVTIRYTEIRNAASRFAASLGIPDIRVSDSWISRFNVMHNIVKRKMRPHQKAKSLQPVMFQQLAIKTVLARFMYCTVVLSRLDYINFQELLILRCTI